MVGIANITTHRHAKQLATKVIFKPGTGDLFAIKQIFRTDEADHRIDQKRRVFARDRIGARLDSLLIDAFVGIGRKRSTLPGFKIHDIVADRAALKPLGGVFGLGQHGLGDAKAFIGLLRAGNRLEHQINRGIARHNINHRRDMGQNARLGRDIDPFANFINQFEKLNHRFRAVSGRVDANDRIAAAMHQTVKDRGRNTRRIISRMIGLQAHRKMAGQADSVAKGRHHMAFLGNRDQVLIAHQF